MIRHSRSPRAILHTNYLCSHLLLKGEGVRSPLGVVAPGVEDPELPSSALTGIVNKLFSSFSLSLSTFSVISSPSASSPEGVRMSGSVTYTDADGAAICSSKVWAFCSSRAGNGKHEFYETCKSVTFYFMKKRLQTML